MKTFQTLLTIITCFKDDAYLKDILLGTHFFLRTEFITFSTHMCFWIIPLSSILLCFTLQCQKETNEQVRIASVVT